MSPAGETLLHVLVLPSWYPTWEAPLRGIFFREQAFALQRSGLEVGVAYAHLRRLRTLSEGGWTKNRFQVSVAIEDGLSTVRQHGWNVPSARWRKWLFSRLTALVVGRYTRTFGRPDLIHAHGLRWAGVAARRIGSEQGVPYVVTEHSSAVLRRTPANWEVTAMRRACQEAKAVLAVSRVLADALASQVGIPSPRVVPNMVDTRRFTLPPSTRSSSPFTFLTVAHLNANKRVDVLLRAFARAFPDEEEVRLVVGGDGPARGRLDRLTEELGIEDRVRLRGRLSRDEVVRSMWDANVFVLSSDRETFGIVLVEAMATGLPVVATASGGPQEIVTEESGLLVEPGNVEQMAGALRKSRHEEPHLRERAAQVRRRTVDTFGQPAVTRRLRAVYRSALGEGDDRDRG